MSGCLYQTILDPPSFVLVGILGGSSIAIWHCSCFGGDTDNVVSSSAQAIDKVSNKRELLLPLYLSLSKVSPLRYQELNTWRDPSFRGSLGAEVRKWLMEDKYSINRQHSGIWRSLRDGDFEEEDVWAVIKERPDYISGVNKPKEKGSSPLAIPRTLPTAARMIPRTSSGNSSASSSHETKVFQQSAPVNIPDWSEIYRNKQNKTPKNGSRYGDYYDGFYHSVDDEGDDGDGVVNYGGGRDSDDEEGEEDDEYDTKLPPHEFIARRLARSQISSFSVFEGVGRTLKGRDLSKVRNAVLTKTGFLESL
ncbi:hypothetical protein VNO77_43024 [Canavalia gladiata]|uniref:Uncharacterized protein n=1 Tax=Canavalia gladiata TaxID=3824 RepID=A0AAN9JWZ0_CANGL